MLLFTPELVPSGREPLEVLDALLPEVDAVQVRTKPAGFSPAPAGAKESWEWTRTVCARVDERRLDVLVLVDDRVDVAASLAEAGCAGVHLGQDDAPPAEARRLLGPDALIGLSTHDPLQLTGAAEQSVDYLGFGPVFPTRTKGYDRGLGAEAAWVAQTGAALPVFPIGGIGPENAGELAAVGRAAVGSALLGADDPAAAARELRSLLSGD